MQIAIIGANGNMGLKRVKALEHRWGQEECSRCLTLCDVADNNIKKLAYPTRYVGSAAEVVSDANITHAVLSTPNSDERDALMLELLSAGKHVLVEKPASLKQEALERAFDLAAANNVCLRTAYNLEYFPGVLALREEMDKLGELSMMHTVYANGWFNPLNDVQGWILDPSLGAGVEYFMGCHMASLLWLFGGDQTVTSKKIVSSSNYADHLQDTACINLGTERMLFNAVVSWRYWRNTFEVTLVGANGMAVLSSLVKYIKYGQGGEKVSLFERGAGLPKETTRVFTYDDVDQVSADLECLDVEMLEWLGSIDEGRYDIDEERRKNLFIHSCCVAE